MRIENNRKRPGHILRNSIAVLITFVMVTCLGRTLFFSVCCNEDKLAIESRYNELNELLQQQDYASAYRYTTSHYQQTNDLERFKIDFPGYRLRPNHSLSFEGDKATLYPFEIKDFLQLLNGPVYTWVKIEGKWYVDEVTWYED